ncbi:hypothetical protein ACWKSR_12445, partial [Campylobacter fetus subsp. venerealis]
MQKYIIILFAFLSTSALFSCGEDFLDLSDPNAVPAGEFLQTPTDVEAAVNGIYQAIRSNNALG